ncbi:MAG: hypothetical protein RMA76_42745 [Deltaproteobacteria bacterium]|jgi:hypothetical protein
MNPRTSTLLSLLGAVLGAAALVVSLTRPEPRAHPEPAEPRAAEVDRTDDGRVQALEHQVRTLAARVSALERRTLPTTAVAEAPEGEVAKEIETLREDVDAVLAYQPLDTEAGRKRLETIVRGVQDDVFRERGKQMRERFERREDERFQSFVEDHSLDSSQTQVLRQAIDAEREKLHALFEREAGDGPPDFDKIRPALEAARDATKQRAAEVLDATQLEAFEEIRRFGPGRGRGPPR